MLKNLYSTVLAEVTNIATYALKVPGRVLAAFDAAVKAFVSEDL
jgi:hypothetical protein